MIEKRQRGRGYWKVLDSRPDHLSQISFRKFVNWDSEMSRSRIGKEGTYGKGKKTAGRAKR